MYTLMWIGIGMVVCYLIIGCVYSWKMMKDDYEPWTVGEFIKTVITWFGWWVLSMRRF